MRRCSEAFGAVWIARTSSAPKSLMGSDLRPSYPTVSRGLAQSDAAGAIIRQAQVRKTRCALAYHSTLTEDRDPGAASRQGLHSNGISARHAFADESRGDAALVSDCTKERRPVPPSGESLGEVSGYYRSVHKHCIVFQLSCQGPFLTFFFPGSTQNK